MILSSDLQQLIDTHIATGRYTDTEDVLRHALSVLDEQQHTINDLETSRSEMETGRVRPLEEIANDIRKRHGWSES